MFVRNTYLKFFTTDLLWDVYFMWKRKYKNTNTLTYCCSLPDCKCEIFSMDCGHTKCLSWNIKYFLSYWVISTRITACLCFKNWNQAYLFEKQKISSSLFLEDSLGVLSAGVASALLLPGEESHQDSPRPSVHCPPEWDLAGGLGTALFLCLHVCVRVNCTPRGFPSHASHLS